MVKVKQHTIKCDLCHGEFKLAPNHVREVQVTLNKEGLDPCEATLTFLECPICGKRYIVILDNAETLGLATKLRGILAKQRSLIQAGKPSGVLEKKRKAAEWKLGFHRQKLAEKYYGSFYQLEGTTEQLDYRYQAR